LEFPTKGSYESPKDLWCVHSWLLMSLKLVFCFILLFMSDQMHYIIRTDEKAFSTSSIWRVFRDLLYQFYISETLITDSIVVSTSDSCNKGRVQTSTWARIFRVHFCHW
jgi:hypothetical protein